MRIVDFLSIVLAASLTSVHSKPAYGYGTLLLTDDIIRVKKRNEESTRGYLEQCGPIGFPMAQRGVVNVLAFLDSSWPYSHRQAIMLKMLNDRLRRSGLPDALFFVVNVDPSFPGAVDDAEDEIEKEAWLGVSPDEIESFSDIDKTADSLELSVTPDIRLIQDNENLGIWKNLRGSRDQVLVIDRCGKLTYQVIVPWSILHFPYVKAAILSTYNDEPCGPCDIVRNSTGDLYDKKNKTTTTPDSTTEDYFQNDRGSMIVSDRAVTTESYPGTTEDISTVDGAAESFASSTSEYRFENSQDTNEETSITSFLEFHIATESKTATNLISQEDNCAMEFESEKFDESTTLPLTMDITTGSTYLHDTEDAISTSFDSYDTTDLVNTATSDLTTEDPSNSDDVKITRLPTEEDISMNRHYLQDTEDVISTSFFTPLPAEEKISKHEHYLLGAEDTSSTSLFTSDITDSINTVTSGLMTEDASSSDMVSITRSPEEELPTNDDYLDRITENLAMTTSNPSFTDVTSGSSSNYVSTLDTIVENIETTTEEAETSTVDKILSEDQSVNETSVEKDDVVSSRSGNFDTNLQTEYSAENYRSTENTTDRKLEKTLNSGTTENVPIEENLGTNEDFHLRQDGSKKTEDTERTGGLFEIPIRIIMHAPHFHVDGESTRMHEYLVLKTGSAEHHSHLGSHDATRLYSGPQDFHSKSGVIPSEEIEAKPWSMANVIYNKNESPGLYGEVADFWREAGSQEIYEDGEGATRPEDQQIAEEAGAEVGLWKKPAKANDDNPSETASVTDKSAGNSSLAPETIGVPRTDVIEKNPTIIEDFNDEEEETRNRLIAHYSKLLPWIYYVLDK